MNTPAHVVVNLLILGQKKRPQNTFPIVVGALLPDLPMLFFYLYEKVYRKMAEVSIWAHDYYKEGWQTLFDLFNSLPLMVLGLVLAYRLGASRLAALFASMVLHILGDAFLHHNDAHRHLFPFSDWRFHSPISYWDPKHFGHLIGPLEALAVVVGCIILARRSRSTTARALILFLLGVYAVYWAYALWVWA